MSAPALSPGSVSQEADPARRVASAQRSYPHAHPPPGVLPAVQSLIVIIVIAVFILTFTVQPFRIPTGSMEPTLMVGDFLLVDKQAVADSLGSLVLPSPAIHRGDVVVFHFPVDPDTNLVKRVVGIPGDHIRLRGGRVLINGLQLEEPYAVYRVSAPDNFRDNFPRLQSADPAINSHWWIRMRKLIDNGELIVPAGNYFVLGDNRNDSEDSRYWGFVPRENIIGRPFLIYFSLNQADEDEVSLPQTAGVILGNRSRMSRFARWNRVMRVVR
jgi:signal peptidase I